jgi:hypothetical protein
MKEFPLLLMGDSTEANRMILLVESLKSRAVMPVQFNRGEFGGT